MYGGIFIGENTWLLNYNPENRKSELDFSFSIDSNGRGDGFIMMKSGLYSKFKKQMENKINDNSELAIEFIKEFHRYFLDSKNPSKEGNENLEDYERKNSELVDEINLKDDFEGKKEKNSVQYKKAEIQFSSCFSVQHLYNDENIKDLGIILKTRLKIFF